MRTTISIDDDVLFAIKERARRENRSAGEVLTELARLALTNQNSFQGVDQPDSKYGFRPFQHRGEAVSNALIYRIRDDEFV
ncbi:MAG TPA: CopG family transcriptional regulator [Acidimicrobiales bacterium]|nr:CopG family transcriptional regulator [Acidimicrobiales bacterium]